MIFKKYIIALLGATALIISTSCDSGSTNNAAKRFLSLEQLEIGDTLRYTTTAGERDPVSGDLFQVIPDGTDVEVIANSGIQIRDVTLTYEKTGPHTFSYTGEVPTVEALEEALRLSLGSPSPINSRFRALLLQPTRSRADLQEIVRHLRALNVEVGLLPTEDTIVGLFRVVYRHRLDSTNQHILDGGDAFGLFTSRQIFFKIKFQFATNAQIDAIRFITADHQIPYADTDDTFFIQPYQAGVFNLQFLNQPVDTVNP